MLLFLKMRWADWSFEHAGPFQLGSVGVLIMGFSRSGADSVTQASAVAHEAQVPESGAGSIAGAHRAYCLQHVGLPRSGST